MSKPRSGFLGPSVTVCRVRNKMNVDYSLSLVEMIKRGKYDQTDSNITEKHFPSPSIPPGVPKNKKLKVALKLVHFDQPISLEDAIAKLKKLGCRPATIWELLFFGMLYPNEQRAAPIVALGSVWPARGGHHYEACLWSDMDERLLELIEFGGDWGEYSMCLAVCNS